MKALEVIAKELREYAALAHGDPPTVRMTATTLLDYASAIDECRQQQPTKALPDPTK